MVDQIKKMIPSPNGDVIICFAEADPKQRIECIKLAATEFAWPLNEAQLVERDTALEDHPLTKGSKWHFWCVFLQDNPQEILATCRTVHRDLLIRDANGVRKGQGSCLTTVITAEKWRNRGVATFLVKRVTEWLDGPGNAEASFIYRNFGELYTRLGWPELPSFVSQLPATFSGDLQSPQLPSTRPLSKNDIPGLCLDDIETIKTQFEAMHCESDTTFLAVLPTPEIIDWLEHRNIMICEKILGKSPTKRGSICEEHRTWLYWVHELRRKQLFIQRIVEPVSTDESATMALAKLLIDAMQEAKEWGIPVVSIWNASDRVKEALDFLNDQFGLQIETKSRVGNEASSLRWRGGDQSKYTEVLYNEHFPFN